MPGVRRDAYFSSTSFPMSCENPGVASGLTSEDRATVSWLRSKNIQAKRVCGSGLGFGMVWGLGFRL